MHSFTNALKHLNIRTHSPHETLWHKELFLREAPTLISGELGDSQRCGAGEHTHSGSLFTHCSQVPVLSRQDLTMRFFISNLENGLNTLVKTLDWQTQECLKSPLSYFNKGPTAERIDIAQSLSYCVKHCGHCFDLRHPDILYSAWLLLCAEFGFYASIGNPEIKLQQMHTRHFCMQKANVSMYVTSLPFLFSFSLFPILILSWPNLVFGKSACL